MRLLVVDDDAFVRVLLCLDLPEVELLEVTRVQEAVDVFARRERIDGCIVDLRLADGDGLDVVRQARSREWTRSLPIVVLTAGFVAADVLAAIETVLPLDATERRNRRRRLARGVEVVDMQPSTVADDEPAEPGTLRRFWRATAGH
jgi:CheY-like chemotaxis protein